MSPDHPNVLPTAESAPTHLRLALHRCRGQFVLVGVFSGVVNLLQLTTSLYMMQVFDRVLGTRVLDTLLYLTLIALAAILVSALLDGIRNHVMQRLAGWVERCVAPQSFHRAIENALRNRPYQGEALRDLAVWRTWLGSGGVLSLYDVPWIPVYVAVLFLLHPALGLIAVVGATLLLGLTLLSDFATSALLKQANAAAVVSQRRVDSIARNAEVIDSMGMLPAVTALWWRSAAAVAEPQQRAADRAAILMGATRFVRLALQIAVLGLGAYLMLRQDLTVGASIAGSIILGRALAPVEQVIAGWKQLIQARQSFRQLDAFLAQPRVRPDSRPLPAPSGQLSVEHASYAVPGRMLIRNVTFGLPPGTSLAVIGPSAAGKTTLVRLLIGTLRPTSGAVRLDGADVHTWMREDFGRYVGYLPQDVELFDGTVFANIARMAEAAPTDVYEAARLAGCHELILRLPDGYATEIGEGGVYLSGGQRQLIGLARAMFGQPKLVVLDEPNSNLDGEAEAGLTRSLERLKALGTTVVLVSHRPALVQGVDKVLLMKDGVMDIFGPRADVLRRLMQSPRPVEAPAASAETEGSAVARRAL